MMSVQDKTKEQLIEELEKLRRRNAELEKLETERRSEEVLKQAQIIAKMGSWVWNVKSSQVIWSDNLCSIHGIEPGAFNGNLETGMSFIHPDDLNYMREIAQQLLDNRKPIACEYRIIAKDKKEKVLRCDQQIIVDDKGEIIQIMGFCQDITGLKRAEEQTQRQQYYLEKAQEIGAIGTWELDIVQNILTWTDQNYRNFGVPLGTPLTYETFLNQVHPDDREYVNSEWMAAVKGKPYDIAHRLITDGKIRWVREKADVTFDEQGNGIYAIGFTQDITLHKQMENELIDAKKEIEKWNMELGARVTEKTDELKKSQNLLIQSEKLSAMGKMAGGLAHELNSPLAGLVPMLELHRNRAPEGSREREETELMLKTALHMAKIVKDFGIFSRQSESKFRTLSVNEVIEDTLSFSAIRLKHKGIKVKKELSSRLPLIHGDKTELQQVVLNMITNALDAMNEGGSYLITTDASEDNSRVKVVFTDDGAGIAQKNLNKIFDPFFTTKKEGEGTGLGLSVSYGIIKNHSGEITVKSKPGKGTSFSVHLPAVHSNNK